MSADLPGIDDEVPENAEHCEIPCFPSVVSLEWEC